MAPQARHFPWQVSSFTMLLLLSLLIASLVSSVSIPIKNPTCARSPHSGLSYTSEECTDLDAWGRDQYTQWDCYNAVQVLNRREVYEHGVQEWEFLAPGARPEFRPPSLTMQTPRRYTYGQSYFPFLLFLALLMLEAASNREGR